MADWLERAKRAFSQTADPVTANTAERNPTAVTAVPDPGESEIAGASIGSNGSTTVKDFKEADAVGDDDRRACVRCADLTGRRLCLADRHGKIVESPLPHGHGAIMAGWLLRARREIAQSAGRGTAVTAERNTAAGNVSNGVVMGNAFGGFAHESSGIRNQDGAVAAVVCVFHGANADLRTAVTAERNPTAVTAVPGAGDAEISRVPLGRDGNAAAADFEEIEAIDDDDRRTCTQCANLTGRGRCLAARRGEIVASGSYEPVRDLRRRCEGYLPGGEDVDRRPGPERWPGLIWEVTDDAGQ